MDMNEDFLIRPLTPGDESFLWEMLYHAVHVPQGQVPPPRSIVKEPKLAHYVRDWGQRPGDCGFAVINNATEQPVGAAWLRLFSRLDPGYGFVDADTPELSIAVLPGYRGRGLGTLLLNILLEFAGQKFPSVSLSVSADNAAKNLYERHGFSEVHYDASSLTMLKRFHEQLSLNS